MKRNRFFTAIGLITAVWFSACTNDEPMDPNVLPEGKYPLEIASVTMSVESSSKPWNAKTPQTRVTENADGMSSVWQNGDKIKVQIGSGTPGTYTYQDGSLTVADGDAPAYWASKNENQSIRAWYTSSGNETVELSDQFGGLAYVLTSNTTANFNQPVSLSFDHALAKIRINVEGPKSDDVYAVKIKSYTTCINGGGTLDVSYAEKGWINMMRTKDSNGDLCWEANVVPDEPIKEFQINEIAEGALRGEGIKPKEAKINSIEIIVKSIIPDGSLPVEGDIKDNANYVVRGNNYKNPINITGGSPHIYLEYADINVSNGNAINITGGNPTIHVVGAKNSISSSNGAGIFVAEGSTVTITGSSREDKLTVTGNKGGSGIGGYSTSDATNYACGNITIRNVTLTARSEGYVGEGDFAAGIGSVGERTVGSISISNATIYAQGGGDGRNMGAAAIGGGVDGLSNDNIQTVFNITISNSTIHASRGCPHASYIGAGGLNGVKPAGYNIISTAKITDSYIYDESGNEIKQ